MSGPDTNNEASPPALDLRTGRSAEAPYRAMVEHAHEGIWMLDSRGVTTFVNPRMAELLGCEVPEILGLTPAAFMFEEDRASGAAVFSAPAPGKCHRGDQRFRRRNDSELWTLAAWCPVTEHGAVVGAIGMFTDITERKHLERTIALSEERYRATFENAAVGMAHVGLDGRWLHVNQKICELMGYERSELMALTFSDITHPDDLAGDWVEAERVRRGEIANYTMRKRYRRRSGDYFWADLTVSILRDSRGEPLHYISVVQDASEQQRAWDELGRAREQAVRDLEAKNRFLAALSHELRTSLGPLLLLASDALADPTTPEHLRGTFTIVEEAVTQQSRIIGDLLDLTRITSGNLVLSRQELDLGRFLDGVVNAMRPTAARKQLALKFQPYPEQVRVNADAARLRQVFTNLLDNAFKFTPEDGVVTLSLEVDESRGETVAAVTDSGMGMTAAEQSRLFRRFVQGDHASASPGKFGGLGLGLTICKGFVEQHGGSMSAHSPGPGGGSTFTVRLPRSA